jgi:hypothetical protein
MTPTVAPASAACSFIIYGSIALIPTLEDLARQSPDIVVGTIVERLAPVWGPESVSSDGPMRTIETHYRVRVEELIRGESGDTLLIRQIGGSLDGCTQSADPQARISKGQHVLLFLADTQEREAGTTYAIMGVTQGYWIVAGDGSVRPGAPHFEASYGLPLEQVVSQIRDSLVHPGEGSPRPEDASPPATPSVGK